MNTNDKSSRIVLVTGGNKGIGFAVARQLAARGDTVWIGCRDEARGRAAAAELATVGDVRFVALDVTDDSSVAAAAAHVAGHVDHVDVVVNNAGIYISDGDGPATTATLGTLRRTYDANFFGPLRVTQAFLPLLRAARTSSATAHVVNVSSGLGSLTLQADPASGLSKWSALAYSSSKTALNALTVALANELRPENIVVVAVNPGFVATDLNGHTGTGTADDGARDVVAATLVPLSSTGTFLTAGGTLPW